MYIPHISHKVSALQEVQLQGLGLWLRHGPPPWSPGGRIHLPGERLMDSGYACLLQEGGITLTTLHENGTVMSKFNPNLLIFCAASAVCSTSFQQLC